MHFSNILIAATAFFGATQAVTGTSPLSPPKPIPNPIPVPHHNKTIIAVSYDTGYDDPSRSLTTVSCSDGVNGLITKYGWQTQGDVHRFPLIGGKAPISWNSAEVRQFFPFLSLSRTPKSLLIFEIFMFIFGFWILGVS